MSAHELIPAIVRVPASTSNLGAGFDCLGLAIDRYLTASFEPGPTATLKLERTGTLSTLAAPVDDDLLVRVFREQLIAQGGPEPAGTLHVNSQIPVGRGLGSSAAATVAGLALARAVLGDDVLDRNRALQEVVRWEGHADNGAPALFGGLIAVAHEDGRAHPLPFPLSDDVGLVFAAPPVEIATRATRAALPDTLPHAVAARGLGRLAALLQGLAEADPEKLRIGFSDQLHVPYRLPLIPGAEAAMHAAREAGAWAVTISGSGSGLIATSPVERADAVARAMADAFHRAGFANGVVAFVAQPDREGTRLVKEAASTRSN